MSLWQRLRRALGGVDAGALQNSGAGPLPGAAAAGERRRELGSTAPGLLTARARGPAAGAGSPAAPASGEEEAQRIYTYVRRIGPLDERPERCDPEILAALLHLWQDGREAQAVSLGGALASALPHDARLQLAVAELLCMQRDHGSAEPLLQRALAAPDRESRLRARFLLHEVALAADQAEQAVTHLAHLLAEDFSYPGARARLAAVQVLARPVAAGGVRLALERPAELPALPAAAEGGLAVPAAPTLIGLPSGGSARYQLLRELGCGSAGTVYLARDAELHCELALKVFHPRDGSGGDAALLRALHEARLLAAVRHPGVIALYDIAGELPDEPDGSGGGPPRLAMELCRGGSLRARLHSGPLPPAAALQRTAELLATLAAVHGSGIVHGDLKPENLLFRGPGLHRGDLPPAEAQLGDLVLSDFGLARLGEPGGAAGRGLGTLGYAAPEQLGGSPATPASDLYAVAVVLLEMLGEPPPRRAEALSGSPPQPRVPDERWAELAERGAPPGLPEFLAGLLAPDPAARPSATAALAQLDRLRASVGA